jgi:hypothetical protein
MPQAETSPKAVKKESRIAFGISYFATEVDANAYAVRVREQGLTYNGGFLHGVLWGRAPHFDHRDRATGQRLFAVTD